jgi:phage baseplate assembly protein gpV
MLSPSGDYRQAVSLPMTWSDQNSSPSQKGDENVITYGGAKITLDEDKLDIKKGGVTVKITGSNVEITAADIKVNGNVEVDGDFKSKSGTFTHNDVFIGDEHEHTKIERGDDLSGPPPGG